GDHCPGLRLAYVCSLFCLLLYGKMFDIIVASELLKRRMARRSDGMGQRKLTGRQRQILDYLVREVRDKGYAPSVREIGVALGLRSPSTVHQHLTALEHKGCIKRHGDRMRALEVMDKSLVQQGDGVVLPLVGKVSAGQPTLAEQHVDDYIGGPPRLFGDVRGCVLLRGRRDRMLRAGILPRAPGLLRPPTPAAVP